LTSFCIGDGLDLGFGGDPINETAVRIDMKTPYTKVGNYPVQFSGDACRLYWFNDNCLDYIYSSHLLEDFQETEIVLREWLRVLKVGGKLIIFCPDEKRFRKHCKETGQPYNKAHIHEDFSLQFLKEIFEKIGNVKIVYELYPIDIYSFDLVVEKI
jgi:predicted SAM-dependent methyltransferase